MPTYTDEKRRRIAQFAEHLRLMGLRAHKIVKGSCFTIFEESPPDDARSRKLKESTALKVDSLAGPRSALGRPAELSKPGNPKNRRFRYLQLAFMRDCFYLEVPNNTVFPQEVNQILRCRLGFYWAKDRPDFSWVRKNWTDIVKWNPLQKVYIYRDEESAAEDMAFIMFQVWKFPVDWRWYIRLRHSIPSTGSSRANH